MHPYQYERAERFLGHVEELGFFLRFQEAEPPSRLLSRT